MDYSVTVTMWFYNNRLWYIFIILVIVIKIVQSNENDTSIEEGRRGRVSGRIVKLYSGIKNDPILCPKEGFLADPVDCSVFYRCLKASNGKYTVFRFQCGPGTVYDPETEVCNHPHSTKRSECGGFLSFDENNKENEIEDIQSELPSPITTKSPVLTEHPVTKDSIITSPPNKNDLTTTGSNTFNAYLTETSTQIVHLQGTPSQSYYDTRLTTIKNTHDSKETYPISQTSELCTNEGFMGDSINCRKFYRCVSNQHGGFIRYEFFCSNLTVWDDDTQGCNHVWAARNIRCGKDSMNELTEIHSYDQYIGNKNISLSQKQTPSNANEMYQSQIQTGYGWHLNQAQYGDKVNIDNKKSTTLQNRYSVTSSTQMSNTPYLINDRNYEKYTQQQQNSPSQTVDKAVVTTSPTFAYENGKKPDSDYGNYIKMYECKNSGFISDVNDCTKFYRCVYNGRGTFSKYEFTCSPGTVWDPKLEACNYVWAVKECRNKAINEKEIASEVNSTQYQTSSVHSILMIEEADGYGNQHSSAENPDQDSSKINANEISSSNFYADTEKCKESGLFADTNNCQIFYKCVDNGRGFSKYLYKCDEGTLWDSNIKACNYANMVKSCNQYQNNPVTTTSSAMNTPISFVQTTTQSNRLDDDYDVGYNQRDPIENQNSSTAKSPNSKSVCTSSGFLGDLDDCKKFYRCIDNSNGGFNQYEFSCGEGTVWDPSIEACNHAWAVKNCGTTKFEQITTTHSTSYSSVYTKDDNYVSQNNLEASTTTKKLSTLTEESNKNKCDKSGFMGDSNDCKRFYRCVDDGHGGYIQYQFVCGEGTVWDPKIEACNHQMAVEKYCGSSSESNEESITHSSTHFITDSQQTQNTSPSEALTHKTSTVAIINSVSSDNSDECKTDGFMGNSKDCRKFYRCVDDGKGSYIRYEFSCGEGTVWDDRIQSCNHEPDQGTCNIDNDILKTTPGYKDEHIENNSRLPSTTASLGDFLESSSHKPQSQESVNMCTLEGFYPNTIDCQKYYRCVDDGQGSYTKYDFTCGDGTVWDQEIKSCNHKSNNKDCKNNNSSNVPQEIPTDSYSSSSPMPVTQQQLTTQQLTSQPSYENYCTSDGFHADLIDCMKFYRCVDDGNGGYTKFDFTCAEGTIWVQSNQVCDHNTRFSNCSTVTSSSNSEYSTNKHDSSSITTTTTTTSIRPDTTQEKDNDEYDSNECTVEGFFPNEDDCRKFYRCVYNEDGKYSKYEFSCGEGTAWDINIRSCNHINEVESCQYHQLPSQDSEVEPAVDDEQVSSQSSESTSTNKMSTTTPLTTTNDVNNNVCNDEGFFGYSDDCKKFYRCVSNQHNGFTKYDFVCGDGTIWDQDILACNHPQDVTNPSCNSTNDNSSIDSGTSSTTTTSSSSSSSLPTISSSSRPTSEVSTSSERTSTTPSSTSNVSAEDSSNKPDNQNYTCTKAGFYADPNDCKKFYRCVDWDNNSKRFSIYYFECDEGTIWDPALDTCNHENSVYPPRNCSSSQQYENSTQGSSSTTTEVSETPESTSEITTQPLTTESITMSTEKSTTAKSTTQTSTSKNTTPSSTTKHTTTTQSSTLQTTTEQTTMQASSTSEQTTATQSSTTQPTSEQTTTQDSSSSEQTTATQSLTPQSTTEETTTQASSTSEQTTKSSTTEQNASTEKSTTNSEYETTTSQQTSSTSDSSEMSTSTLTSTTTTDQTTEQSTPSDKDEPSSTTEKLTTQTSSTEEETTENQNSTTTTTESNQESTTQTNGPEKNCPETNDDENVFVCPTSFRRHPKYCNMFYQCTEEDDSHDLKIATFQCPNNTIYDEGKIQCVEEKKAEKKCNGEIAQKRRVKRLDGNFKEPIIVTKEKLGCTASGHFLFDKNEECSPAFLRCKFTKRGVLQGFIYRCPEGYVYWSISRKCEAINKVKDCRRSQFDWSERHEIPIETLNVAYTNLK